MLAEQQAQAQGIYHPAQQDHAQQRQQQAGVEALKPGQQFATAQHYRHQHGAQQCQAQPAQAVHALAWPSSQADLVNGTRPCANSARKVRSQYSRDALWRMSTGCRPRRTVPASRQRRHCQSQSIFDNPRRQALRALQTRPGASMAVKSGRRYRCCGVLV
ncbi:hypothetical protein D3C80_1709420 [compost metagenome]